MSLSLPQAFARNFLGHAPDWYKLTIVAFLVVNPLVLVAGGADGPALAGWLLLLEFIFTLRSEAPRLQELVVDYAIHYRKADGRTSKKVFKLKELGLSPRASVTLTKRQRIQDLSTRKHYPGVHTVEVLVNGKVMAEGTFDLSR